MIVVLVSLVANYTKGPMNPLAYWAASHLQKNKMQRTSHEMLLSVAGEHLDVPGN